VRNRWLLGGLSLSAWLLQALVLYVPPMNALFHTVPLPPASLLPLLLGWPAVVLWAEELRKPATSLPELAVTLAALRLRAPDLAIANLLGSNLFNLVLLAIDDMAYLRGPLLVDVSISHVGTAVTAMTMTGLVMIGLVLRPQGRVLRCTSWIGIGLVVSYAINAALLTLRGG
jgi:hypothetical protein